MQACTTTCFVQPLLSIKPYQTHQNSISITSSFPINILRRGRSLRAASMVYETSTVSYDSTFSVFPVEACEIVGGEACKADMYPEARLPAVPQTKARQALEAVDREYFDYSSELQSVLKGEACDDLGGEFCEAP